VPDRAPPQLAAPFSPLRQATVVGAVPTPPPGATGAATTGGVAHWRPPPIRPPFSRHHKRDAHRVAAAQDGGTDRSDLDGLPARRGAEETPVARRTPSQPARFGLERSRLGADFIAARQLV